MQIASGTYTGNGTSQSITGVGFQPDVVIVKGGSNRAVVATSTMGADAAKELTAANAVISGAIASLDSDGFSVGSTSQANQNSVTFYWIALKDNSAGDLKVLSYTGNGADNRSITGVGFQPDVVLVMPAGPLTCHIRTVHQEGDLSIWPGSGAGATNRIQALEEDGFQVGSSTDVNGNGNTYHTLCLKHATGVFNTLAYTGDGTDDRSITGAGFQPDNVLLFAVNVLAAARFKAQVGDASIVLGGAGPAANLIQAFESDGFQVGTDRNATDVVYTALVLKDGDSEQEEPPVSSGPPKGSLSLLGVGR